MMATRKQNRPVTLREGVSVRRLAEVLLEACIYEGDIKLLLARHKPKVEPLFQLLEPHLLPMDLTELRKMVSLEQERIAKAEGGAPN